MKDKVFLQDKKYNLPVSRQHGLSGYESHTDESVSFS